MLRNALVIAFVSVLAGVVSADLVEPNFDYLRIVFQDITLANRMDIRRVTYAGYEIDGQWYQLEILDEFDYSLANYVNSAGSIYGSFRTAGSWAFGTFATAPVRWVKPDDSNRYVAQMLPRLPAMGDIVYGGPFSPNGEFKVGSYKFGLEYSQVCYWDENDELSLLDTGFADFLLPCGVSNDNVIVGDYVDSEERSNECFIWDQANGFRDVRDLFGSMGYDLADLEMLHIDSISADGLYIHGQGYKENDKVYFNLIVPEPATLLLLGLGGLVLRRRHF